MNSIAFTGVARRPGMSIPGSGVGWRSSCGHFRLTAGYNATHWFNTVTTDQWIKSVQENDFVGQPDGMSYDMTSFDGLTVRAEYRF